MSGCPDVRIGVEIRVIPRVSTGGYLLVFFLESGHPDKWTGGDVRFLRLLSSSDEAVDTLGAS
jgi:hypothetical protein